MQRLTLHDFKGIKVLRNLAIAQYQANNKKHFKFNIKVVGSAQLTILKYYDCSLKISRSDDLVSETLRITFTGNWEQFYHQEMVQICEAFYIRYDPAKSIDELKEMDTRVFLLTYVYVFNTEHHRLMYDSALP